MLLGFDEGLLRFAPWMIGALVFGLPHGAIDHLVALGLAGKALRPGPFLSVVFLYLLVVIAVLALWMILPLVAALGFLVMTIYHWGKSDVIFERSVWKSELEFRGPIVNCVHLILRGLIPIGLPFLVFPEQAIGFISTCVQFFSPNYEIDWQLWRFLVFAVFAVVVVTEFGVHLRHWRLPIARRILIENFVLTLFFCLVPPIIAIGWYFAGWHGLRHMLRLCDYEAPDFPWVPVLWKRIVCRCWQVVPFTVVSLLMLTVLSVWMAGNVSGAFEAVAIYLVLVSALTLPHLIIVEWMDCREAALAADHG